MKLTEEKLKQIFQRQTASSTARQVDCLTEDQFARAASGAMDQEERSAVARHLIACSDCTEEYRIVRSLKAWANEADRTLAATLSVDARKAAGKPERNTEVSRPSVWISRKAFFPSRVALAVAAMLFVVLFAAVLMVWITQQQGRELARLNQQVAERDKALNSIQGALSEKERRVGELEESLRRQRPQSDQARAEVESPDAGNDSSRLKEEVASLRQNTRELNQPQLEAPIVDLDPAPVRGGSSGAATTIDIPPTAKSFTLILNFRGEAYPANEVEILDGRGKDVWRGQVRGKGGSGSINLTLSRGLIANGHYTIKLYGRKDGRREPIAEYPLQVRYRE
jgi:hypothetical protein